MTNPLNSLNRYPRRPFKEKDFSKINQKLVNITGNFAAQEYQDFESSISDTEFNELLDDVTTEIAKNNISKYSKELWKSTLQPTTGSFSARNNDQLNCKPLTEDCELLSKLMKRIKHLELIKRFQEKEVKDKNLRIKVLEDKCKLYQKSKEIFQNNSEKMNGLEKECEKLHEQILEMENFLADYGLVWVGEKGVTGIESVESSFNNISGNLSEMSHDIVPERFVVDYDRIVANIEELNILVKSDEALVTLTGPQRVELKKKQPIQLTLYANGISLFSGPFRSFAEQSTRIVVQDITDGYFPSELEDRYPSGVPIELIDRRNIFFDAKQINAFQGVGKTLGGISTTSILLNNSNQNGNEDHYTQPFTGIETRDFSTQITMEQFLNKLPTATINKDGRIMSIRNSIRAVIQNQPESTNTNVKNVLINTQPIKISTNECSGNLNGNMARVKIRSLNGETVYQIDISYDCLIKDLYHKLSVMANTTIESFMLVSSFPSSKKLTDMSLTVEDYGLTPNASLCMRLVK